ncbi:enolase C-terminal domain-like protein [Kribbella sp. NPDC000426]|uniref:enolase C-terminal domain-like protein n=1 Tax=Kribbella sp. NPDC000426 TaxID=3154255 RepID=UPI003323B4B7
MTISAVEASAFTIPIDAPEADGTFAWDSTTLVLVEVSADGRMGTGWTYGSPACSAVVTNDLAEEVIGRDAMDVGGCWTAMREALRNIGRPGVAGMALSAVDCALWDLKARLLEMPLHRLLGAVRYGVPVYGSGGFTTYDERQLADQLSGWVGQGIPRVKIKIGESGGTAEDRDLQRVAQARKMIGDAELFVDANGAYSVGQARRLASCLSRYDVTWFEEPVSSDDLVGLRAVREQTSIDVTAGEYGYDLVYFERMCAAGAVDCLQVDVTRCGGISELLRVAAVAEAHGLQVSGHCAPGLHLAPLAAIPNLRHLEWFHDHVRIESMLFDGLPIPADGSATPSLAPGNGLTLRPAAAAGYRVA